MRKFYLINADGENYNLNETVHFLHSPSGLGMDKKVTYEQIGDYFMELNKSNKQKVISAKMFFKTYEEYRAFARFCEIEPLTLMYMIDKVFYIDVNLTSISKSEKGVGGLTCSIKFTANSTFYQKIELKNDNTEAEGKAYDYDYDYEYANGRASTLSFNVNSNMDCPTKLTIIGPAINPIWTCRRNDEIVCIGKVNKVIPEGKRLVIDTTRIPYSITMMNNNGTDKEDVYQDSDFSTERFMLLKKGLNTVRVAHEGSNDITLMLERRELYATV